MSEGRIPARHEYPPSRDVAKPVAAAPPPSAARADLEDGDHRGAVGETVRLGLGLVLVVEPAERVVGELARHGLAVGGDRVAEVRGDRVDARRARRRRHCCRRPRRRRDRCRRRRGSCPGRRRRRATSGPPSPRIVSLPPSPSIVSANWVPVRRSWPSVPRSVIAPAVPRSTSAPTPAPIAVASGRAVRALRPTLRGRYADRGDTRKREWRGPDSNRRHHGFQPCALPTELPRPWPCALAGKGTRLNRKIAGRSSSGRRCAWLTRGGRPPERPSGSIPVVLRRHEDDLSRAGAVRLHRGDGVAIAADEGDARTHPTTSSRWARIPGRAAGRRSGAGGADRSRQRGRRRWKDRGTRRTRSACRQATRTG